MLRFLFGKRSSAEAAKGPLVESPYFPRYVTLGDAKLVRNGTGTRHKFSLKIYDMALYLPGPATTPEQVLAMPGPKQARFIARRAMGGHELAAAMLNGIRNNLPKDQHARFLPYTGQVVAVFKSQDKVEAGHSFRVDLLPGQGAHFYIDDEPKAQPINAPGFNEAILNIWVGPNPPDADLKRHLLMPSVG